MKLGSLIQRNEVEPAAGGGVVTVKKNKRDATGQVRASFTEGMVDTRLKLKPKETLHILIQLNAMLTAGVPLLAALRTLIQHAQTPNSAKLIHGISDIVESGNDLSFAFDCFPRCFPKFCVHLLAAGEKAGALDDALEKSAELMDKQIKLAGKIKGALAYPSFLLVFTVIMTTCILVFLVPKFEKLLMSKPEQLPWTTKLVLGSSAFLRENPEVSWAIGGVFLLAIIFVLKNKQVRSSAFDLVSHMPLLGSLIHKAYITRSVNTLALTLESGVPILQGLEHAKEVSELPRLQATWDSAAAVVRDGRPMHTALADADLPPALLQMIIAGESSGSLDTSLRRAAEFLDRETEAAIGVFTSLLAPATVAIAGGIVGFIVVALMTPILQMSKFVG